MMQTVRSRPRRLLLRPSVCLLEGFHRICPSGPPVQSRRFLSASATRRVTREQGNDPRDFVFIALILSVLLKFLLWDKGKVNTFSHLNSVLHLSVVNELVVLFAIVN